jgi:DNA repair exonuclease SbcCD ATPase subunit
MMPPTPPQSTHASTASREDSLIWSLRTQLAIQQELNVQYEVDLSARTELVSSLTSKLELVDKDKTQRNSVLRTWKKKVQELEKSCRHLEDECERSRQESLERSVMDHASGEALRELHREISRLGREKAEVEKIAQEQVQRLTDELKRREESEKRLREGINEAKEQMEIMGSKDEEEEERQRQRTMSHLWNQEREELICKVEELKKKNLTLVSEPSESERMAQRYTVLQAELEAQWKNTETMTQEITELRNGRDALQEKAAELEGDWDDSENRRLQSEADAEAVCGVD